MPVVMLLAAAAIIGGAVLAALGWGGQMAVSGGDRPPLEPGELTAADVALLRLPMSLWGYHPPATEEALEVIARSVTARDVEIAALRRELAGLRAQAAEAARLREGEESPSGPPREGR